MKRRVLSGALVGLASIAAVTASSASAATKIGDSCGANSTAGTSTVLVNSAGPLSATAPRDGVVTSWAVTISAPGVPPNVQKLQVFQQGSGATTFRLRSESATESVAMGSIGSLSFASRVPIKAGDHIGLTGLSGSSQLGFVCIGQPAASVAGGNPAAATLGAEQSYSTQTSAAVPVVATIEPDVDGDGYGDETQDRCPQSAAYQSCPALSLKTFGAPGKGSLTMLVTSDQEAAVTVTGTAKVPKSKGGKGKRAKTTISLRGGTQTVKPGDLAEFKVKYPGDLKKALAALPASKSITLSLEAKAPNLVGDPTLATLKAKAPGTGM